MQFVPGKCHISQRYFKGQLSPPTWAGKVVSNWGLEMPLHCIPQPALAVPYITWLSKADPHQRWRWPCHETRSNADLSWPHKPFAARVLSQVASLSISCTQVRGSAGNLLVPRLPGPGEQEKRELTSEPHTVSKVVSHNGGITFPLLRAPPQRYCLTANFSSSSERCPLSEHSFQLLHGNQTPLLACWTTYLKEKDSGALSTASAAEAEYADAM